MFFFIFSVTNQIIEKSNEYNLPLYIGFIDYEKAFDTVEHFAIFEALRKTKVNETYINILQNIYNQATARVHLDKLVSTELQIHRGVRQGDPLSPKLFTAVMEEVFKKAEISEGVNVDGENLSNLRFADDVALLNETTKQMEKTPEQSKLRKPESWLKNTQRKDKMHDKPCGQRRHTNRSTKN